MIQVCPCQLERSTLDRRQSFRCIPSGTHELGCIQARRLHLL